MLHSVEDEGPGGYGDNDHTYPFNRKDRGRWKVKCLNKNGQGWEIGNIMWGWTGQGYA